MTYEIRLTNSPEKLLLDKEVFDFFSTDPEFVKIDFLNTLQKHPEGIAVYRKEWKEPDGSFISEITYLPKLIADKFLPKRMSNQILVFLNGNKLDCRLENMEYRDRQASGWD